MSRSKPTTVDAYLAALAPEKRAALGKLRRTIRSIVPRAEECISYGMPAFRVDGRVAAGFLATSRGCSYFPFSGTTLGTLSVELAGYERTKSALHFVPARPLPAALVRKLLAARIAEIRGGPRPGRAPRSVGRATRGSRTKARPRARAARAPG